MASVWIERKVLSSRCCRTPNRTYLVWLDGETRRRVHLFKKINSMSIDEFLQGKVIKVNPTSETDASREFIDLSTDAASILKETMFCKDTVVSAEIDGALTLLICQQPSSNNQCLIHCKGQINMKLPPETENMGKLNVWWARITCYVAVPASNLWLCL